jgi:hypothetical protein
VLSQRLRELEGAEIVRRRRLPPPAASWVYELTDWGRALDPIVRSLGMWALQSPSFPHDAPISADSVVLALDTFFDPDAAEGLSARYELRLGDGVAFRIRVADRRFEAGRGGDEDADAIIEADATILNAVLWNRCTLAEALRAGGIRIEGDRRAVERFVTLFPEPAPA